MLLSDVPVLAAHHTPNAVALRYGDDVLTYAELRDRCWRLANGLAGLASPGDRVAILAQNCPAYVEAYYGVPAAGMALTLLNYRLTARELAYIIGDAAPSVLLVETQYLETIRSIRDQIPSVKRLVVIGDAEPDALPYEALVASGEAKAPAARPSETDLCWLIYTSGTTGLPKGAMLSHRNIMAAILNSLAAALEAPADEVCLFMFPQFHVAGYVMPMYHLKSYPVVLMRSFDSASLLETVQRHRVTNTAIAPTMLAMLLEDPRTDDYDLSSLRRVGYGASAMPGEVLRRARAKWPAIGFSTGFGMTELAGNVMHMGKLDHERAAAEGLEILRSVGRQMPLSRVRVLGEDGRDTAPGEAGEIVVKGDQVLMGYWNKPEATAESFVDGWFRTGDVGRWDEDGYLYIVDRKKDMILTGGENVYPREVEEVLYEHPAVAEAAVIGAPDPTWGESVVAVIRLREGESADAETLIAFCRARIASYKKPRRVVFVPELPKNASGKILKRQLRDELT